MSERGTVVRMSGNVTLFIPDHVVPISGTEPVLGYELKEIKAVKNK